MRASGEHLIFCNNFLPNKYRLTYTPLVFKLRGIFTSFWKCVRMILYVGNVFVCNF